MRLIRWHQKMGSQVSSPGQKSETGDSEDQESCYKTTKANPCTEATNTNAREHNQPDRLKILFRDHRGYRALSEQKVTEWLTKNKRFYNVVPADLTEIPEQIFAPIIRDDSDVPNETSRSNAPRSDLSAHNAEARRYVHDSHDSHGYSRRHRDKMNHYSQRTSTSRRANNHSLAYCSKTDHCHMKALKSISKHAKDSRRTLESEANPGERSTTTGDSLSTRLMNRDEHISGANRRQKGIYSRREYHSVAPKSNLSRRQSDGWPVNGGGLGARRTLPSMLQNNAYIRQRFKCTDIGVDPVQSLQQSGSLKRPPVMRRSGLVPVVRKEGYPRRFELLPVGKDHNILGGQGALGIPKSRSQSAVWRSPYTMKKLHRFAALWMNEANRSPDQCCAD
ncbi:unnamed protein product [Calicophoron daubneyi]|uniref:Uncharacterized protein n=1 Tax=Calicophoron daubneyi TaxID=300641 RepID=A0AAV2TTI1_CALDB